MPTERRPDGLSCSAIISHRLNYGVITALHGISLQGPSKARSSRSSAATARARPRRCAPSPACSKPQSGQILYDGEDITNLPPHQIVARGLCHVPEGRMVFANLTVHENLQMGAYLQSDKAGIAKNSTTSSAFSRA